MGSMITLGIGKMEIDWGKNNVFNNHSCLFQKEDFKKIVEIYQTDETKKALDEQYGGQSIPVW